MAFVGFEKEVYDYILKNISIPNKQLSNDVNKQFGLNTAPSTICRIKLNKFGVRSKKKYSDTNNIAEIGSTTIMDGRRYIKIANKPKAHFRENWVRNDKYLFEKHHNIILAENEMVLHLDGDILNDDISNLKKIDRSTRNLLSANELVTSIAEVTEVNITLAKVIGKVNKIKRGE